MARTINLHKQRGFTLIEAMFSTLILGIALLALAGFQAVALQEGSLIKARAVAANLAQEKLDDLRSFSYLTDGTTSDDANTATTANYCGNGTFCFAETAAAVGGQENTDGTRKLPSGTVSGYIDNYSRAWTADCSAEVAATAPSFSATCNTTTVAKLVTVTISWTDSKGASQSVSLQGVVYAMDPARAARAAVSPSSSQTPIISYTPNSDSVPIPIGGGKSTETSKPLPEVSGVDSKRVTLPSVVYIGSSGSETLVSKEEFATVNCTCNLKSTPETAWTPFRTVWNGVALEQESGEQKVKVVGQPSDLSNSGTTNQDPLCIECCRDHHDTNFDGTDAGSVPDYPAYRPYIATNEFSNTTGNHKHYKADGTEATAGEDYFEACRMKRIDGFWRVTADWLLIDTTVFGCDYFASTATTACPPSTTLDTSKQESFKTWVKNVLKTFVSYMDTNKASDTTSSALPVFSSSVAPLLKNTDDDAISVTNGGNKQLIARAVYADVIFKKKSSGTPRAVDTAYVAAILPITQNDFDKLQHLPFYDANMTLLAGWSPTSTNTQVGDCTPASPTYNATPTPSSAVCVTSEAIETINNTSVGYYTNYYSRGKIFGKLASGSTDITARIPRGNNGLTDSPSIDASTPAYGAPITRTVRAKIPASGTTLGISGKVIRGNSGAVLSYLTVPVASPSDGVACAFNSPGTLATASVADYTCTVPTGWVGTLTFGETDSAVYTFNPGATTASITAPDSNVPSVYVYGATASIKGVINTDNNPNGNPKPDLFNTTITAISTNSTSNGICTNVPTTAGSGEVTSRVYTCVVSIGWIGSVNVSVSTAGGAHTYLSPGSSPCNGSTTGSCAMLAITVPMLADIDGTLVTTGNVAQQTNVTARR